MDNPLPREIAGERAGRGGRDYKVDTLSLILSLKGEEIKIHSNQSITHE
jgi:hypothetical protein